MTFFTVMMACAMGTFVGNFAIVVLIGIQTQKKQQRENLAMQAAVLKFQEQYKAERERMENYARLES